MEETSGEGDYETTTPVGKSHRHGGYYHDKAGLIWESDPWGDDDHI